jgi:hypothetical protein
MVAKKGAMMTVQAGKITIPSGDLLAREHRGAAKNWIVVTHYHQLGLLTSRV